MRLRYTSPRACAFGCKRVIADGRQNCTETDEYTRPDVFRRISRRRQRHTRYRPSRRCIVSVTGRRSLVASVTAAFLLVSCGTEPDEPVNLPAPSDLEAPDADQQG